MKTRRVRTGLMLIWLSLGIPCKSQQGLSPAVMQFDALRAVTDPQPDALSASTIPASLTGFKKMSFGFRAVQPAGYKGMGSYLLTGLFPGTYGTIGFTINHRGYGGWQESQAGIGYGKKLWKGFSAGIKINGYRFSISGYGRDFSFPVELSIVCDITPVIRTSVYISNPTAVKLIKSGERLPRIITFGAAFKLSEQLSLGFIMAAEDEQSSLFQAMMMYRPASRLMFSAACSVLHGPMALSAAYRLKKFSIEICFVYNSIAGFTGGTAIQSAALTDQIK